MGCVGRIREWISKIPFRRMEREERSPRSRRRRSRFSNSIRERVIHSVFRRMQCEEQRSPRSRSGLRRFRNLKFWRRKRDERPQADSEGPRRRHAPQATLHIVSLPADVGIEMLKNMPTVIAHTNNGLYARRGEMCVGSVIRQSDLD